MDKSKTQDMAEELYKIANPGSKNFHHMVKSVQEQFFRLAEYVEKRIEEISAQERKKVMTENIACPTTELMERIAQISAHRACGNQEQDLANGKISGYCVVCQVPWPCETATGYKNGSKCPFCEEYDFDFIGLKIHLTTGACEKFDAIKIDGRHFVKIGE